MDHHAVPKMSLVAQYDDLCRYTNVLTAGCEEEFKVFVESQIKNVKKNKEFRKEVDSLKSKITKLENEKLRLETQMKHLKNLCELEVQRRKKTELEKNSMERQIDLIREVLLADGNAIDNQTKEKLVLLSSSCRPSSLKIIEESVGSLLNLSDCTDDDLDDDGSARSKRRSRHSKGKRGSSENNISAKRKNTHGHSHDEAFTVYEKPVPANSSVGTYRSNSDPTTNSQENVPPVRIVHRSDSEQIKSYTLDSRKGDRRSIFGSTPVGRYSTSGKLSRTHVFSTKTVIRTEKCYPCGRIIKFCKQALKCQDCRVTCHPECKDQCPVPCVPATNTPTKGNMGTIADYTSSTPPMIPSLIVHCVNEIENRGLKEVGLYRISGSEREVKDLKEKFLRGRSVPTLNEVDIHALCGTVKEFLRSLKEPLIPRSAWQTFVDATDITDVTQSVNAVYSAVQDLPQPNKDTLAFIILHLQRVAETPECKMPTENLAKVFGPTIVGYSSADLTDCNMLTETKHQCKVMQCFLSISIDCWQDLLSIEQDVFNTFPKNGTPRLGPFNGSQKTPKPAQIGTTPLPPRNTRYGFQKGKRQFFSSPLLK